MGIDRLFSITGKVALITGGSRGIGRMIAEGFVAAGAQVYISSRKVEACEQLAAELSRIGVCYSAPADLSRPEGAEQLADEISRREPALHVLVNNAGVTWGAPLEQYPVEAFDRCWNVNVKSVFHLTRLLLPQLREAADPEDPARVINIGSVDGLRVPHLGNVESAEAGEAPSMENYAYSASKAAVHMLTRHLAHRLAGEHIAVNAIAPGPFESRMTNFLLGSEEGRRLVAGSVPLGRIGRPDDVVGAALYLASRAGSYLTGAILPVDGGISTHG
jgi:NAD(P)-dependent dehydrogenase (short-subunit alcohol dehydrogenase family)